MISFLNVTKEYRFDGARSARPVEGASFEVRDNDFILIVGRSGSGKTTVLNLAAGLVKPTSGQVLVDGVDLQSMSDEYLSRFRSQKMGFVFQFPSLLPSLTIGENVALPSIFLPKHTFDARAKAVDLLHTFGLKDKVDVYPRQLSAGQQKRVLIARSLINSPSILLADEPTSDLDEQTEREVMEVFRGIHADGMTVVMVTHSLELIRYGTKSLRMENGVLQAVT